MRKYREYSANILVSGQISGIATHSEISWKPVSQCGWDCDSYHDLMDDRVAIRVELRLIPRSHGILFRNKSGIATHITISWMTVSQ